MPGRRDSSSMSCCKLSGSPLVDAMMVAAFDIQ